MVTFKVEYGGGKNKACLNPMLGILPVLRYLHLGCVSQKNDLLGLGGMMISLPLV